MKMTQLSIYAPSAVSEKHCHVKRKVEDSVLFHQILGVENDRFAKLFFRILHEKAVSEQPILHEKAVSKPLFLHEKAVCE